MFVFCLTVEGQKRVQLIWKTVYSKRSYNRVSNILIQSLIYFLLCLFTGTLLIFSRAQMWTLWKRNWLMEHFVFNNIFFPAVLVLKYAYFASSYKHVIIPQMLKNQNILERHATLVCEPLEDAFYINSAWKKEVNLKIHLLCNTIRHHFAWKPHIPFCTRETKDWCFFWNVPKRWGSLCDCLLFRLLKTDSRLTISLPWKSPIVTQD